MISKNWLDLSYSAGVFIKGKSIMATENGGAFDGLSWRNRIIRKMIMKKRAFQSLVFTSLMFAISFLNQANAQTIFTSAAAGPNNWSVAGTWTQSGPVDADGIPDAGDFVTIATGHTINMDAASACSTLAINGLGVLAYTGNFTLAVGTTLTMDGTSQVTGSNAAQILTVGTTLTIPGTATNARVGGVTFTVSGATNISGTFVINSGTGTKTFTGLVTNSGSWTSTSIATAGSLIFRGGITNTGTFAAGGAFLDTNAQTFSGTTAISFSNNLIISGIVLSYTNTANFSVGGATSITGAGGFTDSNNSGIDTFTGTVNISGTGAFNTTTVTTTANLVFAGGINSSGNSFAAGGATFSATQALGGTTTMSFANTASINTGVTVTNNGAITMSNTAAGALTGLGTFIQGANSTLNYAGQSIGVTIFNATNSGNTVNYTGSVSPITTANVNYYHLTYSGSAATANTGTLTTTISGNLNITGTGSLNVNAALTLTVSGNLTISNTAQLTAPLATSIVTVTGNLSVPSTATNARISTVTLTIGGTSAIDGVFSITNDTGVKTFTGAITVSSPSGSWTSTSTTTTGNLVIKNGIANSGTFAGGGATFSTSAQALSGSSAISFANIVTVTGVALTNNNSSTVTLSNIGGNILTGTGSFVQGSNSSLFYSGTSINISTFTPNGSGNTVTFNGTGITVPNTNYYNLTYSGSSNPTVTSCGIAGNLTMTTGTFSASGTVTFNGSANQTIASSTTSVFSVLALATSPATVKVSTNTSITISSNVNFSAGILLIGSSADITFNSGATFAGTPSASSYIQLDGGTGLNSNLIKVNNNSTGAWAVSYPIGTATGGYTPVNLPTVGTAPTAGTTLSIKAIYNASIQGQLRRTFRLKISGNSNTTTWSAPVFNYSLSSDVSGGDAISNYNTIWYLSTIAGSWTSIAGTNAGAGSFTVTTPAHNLVDGTYYYTIGTSTAYPNTWYSYQTGVWSDWTNWTLDPSGTTLTNGLNLPPQPGDEIVILNGITITNDVSGQVCSNTTINSGGILDMAATTSNTLGTVSGAGTLRINGVALPSGTYTSFVTSSGGTVEYYNIGGTIPNTTLNYNNLKLTNSTASNITMITAFNLNVGGTMNITNTGAGSVTWQINNATATALTMAIAGDLVISAGAKIKVGTGAGASPHTLQINGNFTNNGNVQFLDPTDAVFASSNTTGAVPATSVYTTGPKGNAVTVTFKGTADQTVTCSNQTDFYRFVVDKGTDQQSLLILNSSSAYNFRLFGPANLGSFSSNGSDGSTATSSNALSVYNGTLELTGTMTIPLLTTGGSCTNGTGTSCNAYFAIPQSGGLWLNGSGVNLTVADNSASNGDQRLLLQGFLKISAGTLELGYSKGLNSGAAGAITMEGGTLNSWQIRPTTSSPQNFSYIQTGGTVNLGTRSGVAGVPSPGNSYARFSIASSTSSFQMSGGTLNIYTPTTNSTGGIDIQSSASNYSVTGGTVNAYIPNSGNDFTINSTAPLYDLNINSEGTAGGLKASLKLALTVLHNLTLVTTNSPTFSTANFGLTIGGDFTINSSSTFTPGTSVITFNGTGAQTWTHSGTISTTLSDVVISKTSGTTLTLSGTQVFPNIIGTSSGLAINSGTLNIGTKTITIQGTAAASPALLSNSGIQSGTGVIYHNNAAASTIGGTGGVFGNLSINTAFSVTVSGSQSITGDLRLLSTGSILNIGSNNLTIAGKIYSDGTTGTTFSATKKIQCAGFRNDGGLTLTPSSGVDLLFPFGTNTTYAPAIIRVSGGSMGVITARPVTGEHPNVSTSGKSLKFFWRITSSGFSGTTSVTHTYTFTSSSLLAGTTAEIAAYTPARYDGSTFKWAMRTTPTSYDATSSTAIPAFNTGTNWSILTSDQLDGEYTTGNSGAFGTVTVYYSRASTAWNLTSTWSTVAVGGTAASSIPCSTCPVVIGNGALNHSVTIDQDGRNCGSLAIASGSTLDCSTYINLNFGINTTGTGTFRLAGATFPSGDFQNFIGVAGGTVEFYGNTYTMPTTSASGLILQNYYNLKMTPNAGNSITLPPTNLRIYNNLIIAGSTFANTSSRTNSSGAYTVTIDHDLNVTQGVFSFRNGTVATVTVGGDITVSSTGTISLQGGGTRAHSLTVTGNITNNGTIDFGTGTSEYVATTFTGTANTSITGTTTGATTSINKLIVNKGTSQTATLTIDVAGTLNTLSDNWLTLTNGTLNLNKSGSTITLMNATTTAFSIPTTAKLKASAGTLNITTVNNSTSDLTLVGALEVAGATVNIGSSGNSIDNDIEYASAGSPTITISSGILYVNGSVRRPTTTLAGALIYNQTGGIANIGGRNSTTARGIFEIESNTGSSFTLSGTSALNILRTTGVTNFEDLYLNPVTSSVSSTSTISMGQNTSTAAAMSYNVVPAIGNFSILGGGTGAQSVTMYTNDMNATGTISISSNCTLTTNSFNVYVGKDLSILGKYDGSNNTTTFNGTTAQIGTLSNTSSFLNMTVNNTGGSTVSLAAGSTAPSLNNLNILSGTFDVGSLALTVSNNITNNSSQTGSGSITITGSSTAHTISSSNGSFTNLILGGAAATKTITVTGNMSILGTLTFNTTNRYLNIGSNQLTFGTSGTISGAGSTAFIKTNGVSSDLGVVKTWPVGTTASFIYAVGTRTNYTPVTFTNFIVTASGTLTVAPVDDTHPTANPTGETLLSYYWMITKGSTLAFSNGASSSFQFDWPSALVAGTNTASRYGAYLDAINLIGWTSGGSLTPAFPSLPTTLNFSNTLNTFLPTTSGGEYDYTCGTTNTLPNPITPVYSRFADADGVSNPTSVNNSSVGGAWNLATNWTISSTGNGTGLSSVPSGRPVVILPSARINLTVAGAKAFATTINGLIVLSTAGQNLGNLSGTGTMRTTTSTLPAGNYTNFVASTGGTIEYVAPMTMNSRTTYNNLTVSGSGTLSMTNTDITLNGTMTIGSGTTLNNGFNNNISVSKNWANSGTFTQGTGTVSFIGTTASTTSGTTAATFYNLTVNKTGADLTPGGTLTVNNILTMTGGNIISTVAKKLTLSSAATTSGGSSSSFVIGPMDKVMLSGSAMNYPVGAASASRYRPVVLANTTADDTWTVEYVGNDPSNQGFNHLNHTSPINKVSMFEYWNISRLGSTASDVTLSYNTGSYLGSDIGNVANLYVVHWNTATSAWEIAPGGGTVSQSGTNIAGTVTTTNQTSFSPDAIGSLDLSSPLPVTWLVFTGNRVDNSVVLEWATAQERNNDHFEIQRSVDGKTFDKIGSQLAVGNSSTVQRYKFTDREVLKSATYYYRIKQVDVDGQSDFSKVVVITGDGKSLQRWAALPNPTSDNTHFHIQIMDESVDATKPIQIQIISSNGVIVYEGEGQTDQLNKKLDGIMQSFGQGIYIVQISDGTYRENFRIARM